MEWIRGEVEQLERLLNEWEHALRTRDQEALDRLTAEIEAHHLASRERRAARVRDETP